MFEVKAKRRKVNKILIILTHTHCEKQPKTLISYNY